MTAQAIADATNTSLITTKISDDIFRHAELKLDPKPLTKDRDATATFYQHHQIIEEQRGRKIARPTDRRHQERRRPDQPPQGKTQPRCHLRLALSHRQANSTALRRPHDWHVDYSHGIRLMSQRMIVDGQPMQVSDVLKDKDLCVLLSNEGPIDAGYE